MKPALISFALTAALLSLNVLPGMWAVAPAPEQSDFEVRHGQEDKAAVEARLGIRAR
jgi:hypothetical protein